MHINKVVFMEYDELSKLPTAIYDTIVSRTDYGHSEILADVLQGVLDELKDDKELPEDERSYSFSLEEFEDECKNILGEAYNMLLNDELDFISVIYD